MAMLIGLGHLKTLRPSSLFLAFYVLQYGPIFLIDGRHVFSEEFISAFGISDFGPVIVKYTYAALTISYIGMAAGIIATELTIIRIGGALEDRKTISISTNNRKTFEQTYIFLIAAAVVTAIAFLSVDIVRQKLSFFYSLITGHANALEYSTFRRVTFSNDPNAGSIVRLRANLSIPLMALIVAIGFYLRRRATEISIVVVPFAVITIFDLTKQGTLIAALIAIVCAYIVRNEGILPKLRTLLPQLAIISGVGVALLFGLYAIQYIGAEHVDTSVIWQTLIYRTTRMNADCLNLYFVFFQHPLFDRGVSTSSMLAALFSKQSFDQTAYIPQIYGAITSFPDLFFSGMWVDFGWPGVLSSSLAVGVICSIADFIARNLVVVPVKAAYFACMMFALNYFGQIQFLTTVSTYGVASTMIVFSLLDYFLSRRVIGLQLHLDARPRFSP